MPLIARPEHGTVFGLNGQPEPDAGMLAAIRSQCGEVMPQMTHCQQCRADAIGMLGEDRSQQFTRLPDPESLPDWLPILHQRANFTPASPRRSRTRMTPAWSPWPPPRRCH
jgi:nitrogen fixation protein NifB